MEFPPERLQEGLAPNALTCSTASVLVSEKAKRLHQAVELLAEMQQEARM